MSGCEEIISFVFSLEFNGILFIDKANQVFQQDEVEETSGVGEV